MFFLVLLVACSGEVAKTNTDAADTDTDTDSDTDAVTYVDSGRIDTATVEDTQTPEDTETDTVVDTGAPYVPGVDITGRTYLFNPVAMSQIRPAGITVTLSAPIYMMQVVADDGATLDVRFATRDYSGPGQDLCSETLDLLAVDFSTDPALTVGPLDVTTTVGGLRYPMESLTAQMRFNATYDSIPTAGMEMMVDTAPSAQLVFGSASGYCSYLGGFGVPCSSCPSGAPYCIQWRTSNVTGTWDPALSVVPRSAADIQADPSCP
jgi:hypothetical protein